MTQVNSSTKPNPTQETQPRRLKAKKIRLKSSMEDMIERTERNTFIPEKVKMVLTAAASVGATLASAAGVWNKFKALRGASSAQRGDMFADMGKIMLAASSGPLILTLAPMVLKTVTGLITHWKKKFEPIAPEQANFELTDFDKNKKWDGALQDYNQNGDFVESDKTEKFIRKLKKKLTLSLNRGKDMHFGIALHGPGGTGKSHLSDHIAEKFFDRLDKNKKNDYYVARFRITPADFQEHGPEKLDHILKSLKAAKEQTAEAGGKVACIMQFEEMDAIFRSPDQQKQFQTFSDALKNNGISSCVIGTMNETSFLKDESGVNTGFQRRFKDGWYKIPYPNGTALAQIFHKQVEEYALNDNQGLDKSTKDLLKSTLREKLNSYNPTTDKITPARLSNILERTILALYKEDESEKSETNQIDTTPNRVTEELGKAFEVEKKQAKKDLLNTEKGVEEGEGEEGNDAK